MGKNHGKKLRTEADRLRSIFAKLDNELFEKKQETIRMSARNNNKEKKEREDD